MASTLLLSARESSMSSLGRVLTPVVLVEVVALPYVVSALVGLMRAAVPILTDGTARAAEATKALAIAPRKRTVMLLDAFMFVVPAYCKENSSKSTVTVGA